MPWHCKVSSMSLHMRMLVFTAVRHAVAVLVMCCHDLGHDALMRSEHILKSSALREGKSAAGRQRRQTWEQATLTMPSYSCIT